MQRNPVDTSSIALVILAAGGATRFGGPKQLAMVGGKPLVRRTAEMGLQAGFSTVIVVLGAYADLIEPVLRDLPLQLIVNNSWIKGLGTSIRMGVEHGMSGNPDAMVLILADQWQVTPGLLHELVRTHLLTGKTVASSLAGELSPPALFGRSGYPQLMHIPEKTGAKALLKGDLDLTTIESPEAFADLDTPDDLKAIQEMGL